MPDGGQSGFSKTADRWRGDMIASVLRAVDANLPVRLVPATKSKAAGAEPIALRFETGRARLAGRFRSWKINYAR